MNILHKNVIKAQIRLRKRLSKVKTIYVSSHEPKVFSRNEFVYLNSQNNTQAAI